MWSSWFPNGIFPSKRGPNSNLQKRINGLLEAKVTPKDGSPMLKELQTQKNNVKRMSSVYEGNITVVKENLTSYIRQPIQAPNKIDNEDEPNIIPQAFLGETHQDRSVQNSIKIMIQSDAEYIKYIEFLISKYVEEFEALPALRLKNETSITNRQKQELFGQIERIYKLHRDMFHPNLLSCGLNVVKFGKKLSELCVARDFNVYLVHALDEKVKLFRFLLFPFLSNFPRLSTMLLHRTANIVEKFTTNISCNLSRTKPELPSSSLPSSN